MAVARKSRAGITAPGRVPSLPVEVDWSHPLANGLVACYVPGGSRGIVDLTGNGPLLAMGSGAKIGAGSAGSGLINAAASAGASSSATPVTWQLQSAGTVFVSADFFGSPSVGNGLLWGLNFNAAGTTPFVDYSMNISNTTQKMAFAWNSAGTAGTLVSGTLAPTSGRHSLATTFIVGGAIVIYQDAVPTDTGTWTGAGPNYTTPVATLGANPASPTRISNTGIAVALTYNRALSAGEVALLDADPFCMLRPVRRPSYKAASTTLALTGRGSAFSRGQSALALSQALTSLGAAYSHGRGTLSLFAGVALVGRGASASQGRGTLSLNLALASIGSARAHGRGALLLNLALTGRGAAFARGRSALTLLTPLALQSAGSGRSAGKGSLTLLLPLTARGAAVGRGRGILTITGTPLALTSRGAAFSRSRSSISLGVLVALHASRGQAFSHGGALRGGPAGIGVLTLTPFIPSQNVINIGMPQRGLPIADPKTGQMNQNWYLFFHALWQRGGGPIGN